MIINLLVYPWEVRPGSDTIDGKLVVSMTGEDPVTLHTSQGGKDYPRWSIITVGRENPKPPAPTRISLDELHDDDDPDDDTLET